MLMIRSFPIGEDRGIVGLSLTTAEFYKVIRITKKMNASQF